MAEKSFVVRKLHLHSPNLVQSVDLTGLYFKLVLRSDIRTPFLSGTISLYDAAGYSELFPILGEERLEMEIEVLDRFVNEVHVIKKMFRIYEMTPQARNNITVGSAYNLHFISYEFFINQRTKIYDSFLKKDDVSSQGTKLSSIAEILYKKYIKNKMSDLYPDYAKDLLTEDTLRNYQIIFPNMNPYKAIIMCANRSLSSDRLNNKGATYLFYEDFDNYYFQSLEKLINTSSIGDFNYTPDVGDNYFSASSRNIVENYEVKNAFNVRDNLTSGMYSSRMITYDFERMKIKDYNYEYIPQPDTVTEEKLENGKLVTIAKQRSKDPDLEVILDKSKSISPLGKLCTSSNDNLNNPNSVVHLMSTNKDHDVIFGYKSIIDVDDRDTSAIIDIAKEENANGDEANDDENTVEENQTPDEAIDEDPETPKP